MNIYFGSDIHWHHSNMVTSTTRWEDKSICRLFDSLEAHDEYLIELINKCVKLDDIFYFLGDWSFGGIDNVTKLFNRLECTNIHFILGNHDQHIKNQDNKEIRNLFLSVQDRLELKIKDKVFILDHFPMETWNKLFKGNIHLFGHQHSDRIGPGKKMDIGIDKRGQLREPYHIDEVLEIMNKQEIVHGYGDSKIDVKTGLKR